MLTHYNLVANITQCAEAIRLAEDECVLAVLPFFHIYGMTVLMNMTLCQGATVVTMARFDLEDMLRTIERHRVSQMLVPPPVLGALARHPLVDSFDLSSLEMVGVGGAPTSAEVEQAAAERLACLSDKLLLAADRALPGELVRRLAGLGVAGERLVGHLLDQLVEQAPVVAHRLPEAFGVAAPRRARTRQAVTLAVVLDDVRMVDREVRCTLLELLDRVPALAHDGLDQRPAGPERGTGQHRGQLAGLSADGGCATPGGWRTHQPSGAAAP